MFSDVCFRVYENQNGGTGYKSNNGFNKGGSYGGGQRNGNSSGGGFRNGGGSGSGSFRNNDNRGYGNGGGYQNGGGRFGNQTNGQSLRTVEWGNKQLQPFKKDFYVPHPTVATRSQYEVDEYRNVKEISVDTNAPNPIQNFNEANFPDYVLNEISNQGEWRYFFQK